MNALTVCGLVALAVLGNHYGISKIADAGTPVAARICGDDDDADCNHCDPTIQFDVQPVPGSGFTVVVANMGTGATWNPAGSGAGTCNAVCQQVTGCKGSVVPKFGYTGPGIQVCSVPVPPTNCVGPGAPCTWPWSLIWENTNCGSVGAGPFDAFEIYQNGVLVAVARVRGVCTTCAGVEPNW